MIDPITIRDITKSYASVRYYSLKPFGDCYIWPNRNDGKIEIEIKLGGSVSEEDKSRIEKIVFSSIPKVNGEEVPIHLRYK